MNNSELIEIDTEKRPDVVSSKPISIADNSGNINTRTEQQSPLLPNVGLMLTSPRAAQLPHPNVTSSIIKSPDNISLDIEADHPIKTVSEKAENSALYFLRKSDWSFRC